jgi:hypothetical protein
MRRPWIHYTAQELAWIEARKTLPRAELHRHFVAKFDRADVSAIHIASLCKRRGWKTGRTGQFASGQEPKNKGKRMPQNATNAATRFKPGHKPHNTKYLGHERMTPDGYVEISVAEINPHTGFPRRYVHKHRWLWEQANGPVPDGHVLKSLDGDKTNTAPANWICIPRALLPRLSGRWHRAYDTAPAELKPVLLATAKLEHAARTAAKRKASQ